VAWRVAWRGAIRVDTTKDIQEKVGKMVVAKVVEVKEVRVSCTGQAKGHAVVLQMVAVTAAVAQVACRVESREAWKVARFVARKVR